MYTKEQLEDMKTTDIRKMAAKEFDITGASKYLKADLIEMVLKKQSQIDHENFVNEMMKQASEEFYELEFDDVECEPNENETSNYEEYEYDEIEDQELDIPEFNREENDFYEQEKPNETKLEQLALDIETKNEQKPGGVNGNEGNPKLSPEELDKQRRESVALARGQQLTTTVNGKKVTLGGSKLLGILLLIDVHLIIDNLIILIEAFFYYMWYGEKVNVKTEEGYLLLCMAFPLLLILIKKMNVTLNGIVAIIKSFQKGKEQ